jgi:hypothetical protein
VPRVVEDTATRHRWMGEGSYLIKDRLRKSLTHIDGRSRLPGQQLGTIRICTRAFCFGGRVRLEVRGCRAQRKVPREEAEGYLFMERRRRRRE